MPAVLFCSACGARLPSPPPVECSECGVGHWVNPKPCANAIVVDDGKVLLTRRAHAPWRGTWCSPGGFCEIGEHPISTVEREVYEETGLRVTVTGYIGVWIDRYSDEPHPDDTIINVAYYLAAPAGERAGVPDPNEVSEVRWFPWDGLPDSLSPDGTLQRVLAAARELQVTALPDRLR